MTGKVSAVLASITVPSLIQTAESDISMMQRLAADYGAVSKSTNGFWLFLENGAGMSVGGADQAELTIIPDMVSGWNYQEGDKGNGEKAAKK